MSPSPRAILAIALAGVTLASALPDSASASCDVIPSAINEFPSGLGSTNTPFAAPDQLFQVRVRPQVCDAETTGLKSPLTGACLAASSLRATFLFFDASLAAAR